jgi:preprotein translocase subunit SecG
MGFLIGFLTLVMVVDCLALIFLVLIQLPKKDAGAGLAFGGGATDALFGAGSGNVLTKITKWTAGLFFVLAIALALLQRSYHGRNTSAFEQGAARSPLAAPTATTPTTPLAPQNVTSNAPATTPSMPLLPTTNAPAKPAAEQPAPAASSTNAAPK